MTKDGQGSMTVEQMRCPHENFAASVDVGRITDDKTGIVTHYSADVTVNCDQCGLPFHFQGLPCGLDFAGATVSANALEGRFAISPGIGGVVAKLKQPTGPAN